METPGEILEAMGLKCGDIPDTWKGVLDGIHLSISLHPIEGIAIRFHRVEDRRALEGEVFIPENSNKQQIAQALMTIHQQVYSA